MICFSMTDETNFCMSEHICSTFIHRYGEKIFTKVGGGWSFLGESSMGIWRGCYRGVWNFWGKTIMAIWRGRYRGGQKSEEGDIGVGRNWQLVHLPILHSAHSWQVEFKFILNIQIKFKFKMSYWPINIFYKSSNWNQNLVCNYKCMHRLDLNFQSEFN